MNAFSAKPLVAGAMALACLLAARPAQADLVLRG